MNSTTIAILDSADVRSLATAVQTGASVYVSLLPVEPTTDTGADFVLRWRRLAEQLVAQGADDNTISAIWGDLAEQPAAPARHAVFASQGTVRFRQTLPGGTGGDLARFGAPPDVVPLFTFLQQHPPYVLVVTDRSGADVTIVPRGALTGPTTVVMGPDDEIERNAPGGWAQARYQRRAVDSWQHNAAVAAREVIHALHQVGAGLLLIAGDIRATQLLRDQLPAAVRNGVVVRQLPGGRRPDSSGAIREAAIADAIAEYTTAQTIELMDHFDGERRPGGLAVEGTAATLAALNQRRVRTLIVVDDPTDERVAWFGTDVLCEEAPGESRQTSSWEAAGRLVDVAVRAAVLTDAEVRVVPTEQARALGERLGALCRFNQVEPRPGS